MKTKSFLPCALLLLSALFLPHRLFACPSCVEFNGIIYKGYPTVAPGRAVEVYLTYPLFPHLPTTLEVTVLTNASGEFSAAVFDCCNTLALFTLVTYDSCFQKSDTINFFNYPEKELNFYLCEPGVDANISVRPSQNIDMVDIPPYIIENHSIGSALDFTLDFGDGTSFKSPHDFNSVTHIYPVGNFDVCLIASNTIAQDTICNNYQVPSELAWDAPPFTFEKTATNGCSVEFSFIHHYMLAGNSVKYILDYGDGTADTTHFLPDANGVLHPVEFSRMHAYLTPASIATATQIIYSGATVARITSQSVSVAGLVPLAEFSFTNTLNVFSFQSQNTGGSHNWNFGNGTTSIAANPVRTLPPGTYNVCHQITSNGCSASYCDSITVHEVSNALFGFTIGKKSVRFHNVSTGEDLNNPDRFIWDFGDGTTSNSDAEYLTHHFERGIYNVCLTVTGAGTDNQDLFCRNVNTTLRKITFAPVPLPGVSKTHREEETTIPVETTVAVFPNPFTQHLQIQVQASCTSPCELIITNISGQTVYAQQAPLPIGENTLSIDLSQFEKGIYLVRIVLPEITQVFKVMKE